MNELAFYSSQLSDWAKVVQQNLMSRVPLAQDRFHLDDERMKPIDKLKRAVLKAALIGRNLRYLDTIALQEKNWMEVLDPQHRYGLQLHRHFSYWQTTGCRYSFQRWMAAQMGQPPAKDQIQHLHTAWESGVDKNRKSFDDWMREVLQPPSVRFLNERELPAYLMTVDAQGRIMQNGQLIVLKKNEALLFILTHDNKFYVGIYRKGIFHHSSFNGGAAIKAAGEFGFNEGGYLLSISDVTGHYFDTTATGADFRMEEILRQLSSQGVTCSQAHVHLNVHPTAYYTPYSLLARCYFGQNFSKSNWYVGRVDREEAVTCLLREKKPFLIRLCEYPVPLTNRVLVDNLLPIDAAFAAFELLFQDGKSRVTYKKIYCKNSQFATDSGPAFEGLFEAAREISKLVT